MGQAHQNLFRSLTIYLHVLSCIFSISLNAQGRTATETTPSSIEMMSVSSAWVNHIFKLSSDLRGDGICFGKPATELPDSMIHLQARLTSLDHVDPDFVRHFFSDLTLLTTSADVEREIDEKSIYFQKIKKLRNPTLFSGQERPSRFSGASIKNISLMKDKATERFFENLFKSVVLYSEAWNPTRLSRADLFHAHMIYSHEQKDILIVFHSKEYLDGEPSMGEGFPRRRLLEFIGESLSTEISLTRPTARATRRNYIWSLTKNKICGIDTTRETFATLAEEPVYRCTLDQRKLTELEKNGEIANINYFPAEQVPLFFDFHRGK
jgi:hypothetical protein